MRFGVSASRRLPRGYDAPGPTSGDEERGILCAFARVPWLRTRSGTSGACGREPPSHQPDSKYNNRLPSTLSVPSRLTTTSPAGCVRLPTRPAFHPAVPGSKRCPRSITIRPAAERLAWDEDCIGGSRAVAGWEGPTICVTCTWTGAEGDGGSCLTGTGIHRRSIVFPSELRFRGLLRLESWGSDAVVEGVGGVNSERSRKLLRGS